MDINELNAPVDKYFRPNDCSDELEILFDGTLLRDKMIVLIESPEHRASSDTILEAAKYRLRVNNRWCEVQGTPKIENGKVSFIAHYFDGEEVKRVHDVNDAWYVVMNTMPESRRFRKIINIVQKAVMNRGEVNLDEIEEDDPWLEEIAMKINDLF